MDQIKSRKRSRFHDPDVSKKNDEDFTQVVKTETTEKTTTTLPTLSGWEEVNNPITLEEGEEHTTIEEGEEKGIIVSSLHNSSTIYTKSSLTTAVVSSSSSTTTSTAFEATKQKLLQWKLKKGLGTTLAAAAAATTTTTASTLSSEVTSSSSLKKVNMSLSSTKFGSNRGGFLDVGVRTALINEDEDDTVDDKRQTNHDSERLRQRVLLSFSDTISSAPVVDLMKESPQLLYNDKDDPLESFMNILSDKAPPAVLEALRLRDTVITLDDVERGNEQDYEKKDMKTDEHNELSQSMQIDESEDEKKYHELFQKALLEKQTDTNGRSFESTNFTTSSSSSEYIKKSENGTSSSTHFDKINNNDTNNDTNNDDDDDDIALFERSETGDTGVLDMFRAKMAKKEIKPVDHSSIDYLPFRKSFYIEPRSISNLSQSELDELREDLEIKVRGNKVPRLISTWEESGLPDRLLALLEAKEFKAPFSIQRQALPALMSGHDLIGVARTGSGKTLAYLLPLFRQVLDQPPLKDGEGPIALILAPSRELVVQISQEAKKLAKGLGLRVVAVYGGASVSDQIGMLKRGAEVIVCTPGRMIDILTLNSGRLLTFKRVTYVVLDEADRLYDMGFEPQITRLLSLVRPDRQICMFSATFPSHVETLARKVLRHSPVEVIVGGRSKASPLIDQYAELFSSEAEKFNRLLQLLGEWYELGNIIIFCDTKENVDWLFTDLFRAGYTVLTLHGGKDQSEREASIADFKAGVKSVLVATSVAGRGLDVRNLVLVINYSCPNHLEDYVHRVGRTGRAGNKGTAYTFLTPDDASYSIDIVRALKDAKQENHIPKEIADLAQHHREQVTAGIAKKRHSGFSGASGYKFDGSELSEAAKAKHAQRIQLEIESGASIEDVLGLGSNGLQDDGVLVDKSSTNKSSISTNSTSGATKEIATNGGLTGEIVNETHTTPAPSTVSESTNLSLATSTVTAANVASALAIASTLSGLARTAAQSSTIVKTVKDELDINDYPQQARRKLMVDTIKRIEEWTGTAITGRGIYVLPGRQPPPGESRLHLLFEAPTEASVRKAKAECLRILEEETKRVGAHASLGGGAYGKFTV
jgi:ATP-dependent RNA helicase DDX46/PRP5